MREHPLTMEFAAAVDTACGRMIRHGLERDAMIYLALELRAMFWNHSLGVGLPGYLEQSRDLFRAMGLVIEYLENPSDAVRWDRVAIHQASTTV